MLLKHHSVYILWYHGTNFLMFILWYHGTIIMNTDTMIRKKITDVRLAFNSIEHQQNSQILNRSIDDLREKIETIALEVKT